MNNQEQCNMDEMVNIWNQNRKKYLSCKPIIETIIYVMTVNDIKIKVKAKYLFGKILLLLEKKEIK